MLIDLLIILAVGVFIASRFMGFKLPKDDNLKNRRQNGKAGEKTPGWQEMMDKMRQPDPLQPAEDTEMTPPRRNAPARPAKLKVPAGVKGMDAVKAVDENFDEARFLDGVDKAYAYFYDRWNAMDEEGLDNLCGPQLMAELREELEAYRIRGAKPLVTVEEVVGMTVTGGRVMGRSEIVEADIEARQSEGEVGQVAPVRTVKVRWVLARAVGSDDPNWELQSVTPLNAKADA